MHLHSKRGWLLATACAVLLGAGGAPTVDDAHRNLLSAAIENAMSIGIDAFRGQVVAYLDPEHQKDFSNRVAWESLQERVVNALEALRP